MIMAKNIFILITFQFRDMGPKILHYPRQFADLD